MKFQKTNIGQAAKLLADNNRIALFAHTNPDGDTVGACVALCLALRKAGHVCEVFCDSDLGSSIAKFEETSIIRKQFVGEYDLFVAGGWIAAIFSARANLPNCMTALSER